MWTETMFPLFSNLQQSPRLLELWWWKIEKVWGTFSTFYIGVLPTFWYLFLKNKSANLFAFLQNVV